MAAMSTALVVQSIDGGKFTYTAPGHSAQKAKVVVSTSKAPSGKQTVSEQVINISFATEDSDGIVIQERVAAIVTFRNPIHGLSTDVDAVETLLRDVVNSDEFSTSIRGALPLKAV
jgi:hypothetical protein